MFALNLDWKGLPIQSMYIEASEPLHLFSPWAGESNESGGWCTCIRILCTTVMAQIPFCTCLGPKLKICSFDLTLPTQNFLPVNILGQAKIFILHQNCHNFVFLSPGCFLLYGKKIEFSLPTYLPYLKKFGMLHQMKFFFKGGLVVQSSFSPIYHVPYFPWLIVGRVLYWMGDFGNLGLMDMVMEETSAGTWKK